MENTRSVLVAHAHADVVSGAEIAIADMVVKGDKRFKFIMLTPGEGRLARFYRDKGYEIWARNVQGRRRLYPGLHTVQSYYFAKQLQKRGIDVVLCNTFSAASRVGTACRMAGIPYGIYVREYIPDTKLYRDILLKADMVLAVSRDVRDYVRSMVKHTHLVVAHDHLDTAPIVDRIYRHKVAGTRLLPFAGEHPVVGIIGRIVRYKQPDLFIRAIPKTLAKVPEARFVIVGTVLRDKEKIYGESLKRLARELDIEDKVSFMGYREDAIEIMSELTVLCLPSDREPFPRVILEAQLTGCPVIAANTGGPSEMVQDQDTGLLFPSVVPDAAEQLSDRFVQLLSDMDWRTQLAERACIRLQETFASSSPIRQLEDHIETLSLRCVNNASCRV
jgi:glycosyltransferase involved in cell wall biosynthesis